MEIESPLSPIETAASEALLFIMLKDLFTPAAKFMSNFSISDIWTSDLSSAVSSA